MNPIERIMRTAPVIPVLVIEHASQARPLAEALVTGGLKVLEVTLRTPAALDAIREMKQVPGAIVGAGTVTNPLEFDNALDAGAEFVVSPGLTERLARVAIGKEVPFLPGVATASDIMRGLDLGLTEFKFFPAAASGGLGDPRQAFFQNGARLEILTFVPVVHGHVEIGRRQVFLDGLAVLFRGILQGLGEQVRRGLPVLALPGPHGVLLVDPGHVGP